MKPLAVVSAVFAVLVMLKLAGCKTVPVVPDVEPSPSPSVSVTPSPVPSTSPGAKLRLPLTPDQTYLTFYGSWTASNIAKAQRFPLIIGKQGTTKAEVTQLKSQGAKVVLYVSVGEEDVDSRDAGDGLGPIKCDGSKRVALKKGVDSQYVRIADGREKGGWGSWYTDGGNPKWQAKVFAEAKRLIALGADGIFLDTVDTAAPTSDGAPCTATGMADLIQKLRAALPDKYIISNRGLFYLDSGKSTYSPAFRQAISGLMFENYYTSWSNDRGVKSGYFETSHKPAAAYVQREAIKPDGFTVLALDYFAADQLPNSQLLKEQRAEVAKWPGWVNGIGNYDLDVIYTTLLSNLGGF